MEWLEESETSLDSELEIANDPDKIKTQLTQHKVSDFLQNFSCDRHMLYFGEQVDVCGGYRCYRIELAFNCFFCLLH